MRVNHCAVGGAFASPHVVLRWLQAVTVIMFAYHSAAQQDLPVAKFLQIGSRRSQGVLAVKEREQQTPEKKTEEKAEEAKEEPTKESREDAKEKVEEDLEEEIEKEKEEEELKAALGGDETPEKEGAAAEEIMSSLSGEGNPRNEGNELLKNLVESETNDGFEPEVTKEEDKEDEEPDPIAIAGKKLFDEPAEKKYGHAVESEEGEEEEHELTFHYPEDGGHGHAVEHEAHAIPVPTPVKVILVFTPIMVISAVAYFFCVSNIEIDPEALSMFAAKEVHVKLFEFSSGWRRVLGRIMEHPVVNFSILLFIMIDLCCAVIHDVLHQTDLLNPKYSETRERLVHNTHQLSVYILCGFLLEQLVHITVFGKLFFFHFWYVLDLVVCYMSLLGETILNEKYGDAISFLILMRLWKVVAVVFDIFLANAQSKELTEKIEKHKSKRAQQAAHDPGSP